MTEKSNQLKEYIENLFCLEDECLHSIKTHSKQAGLPPIQISPQIGKLLYILAKTQGAKRILEIGTLGGYSTIWLARALPSNGSLLSLEINPSYIELARLHIQGAGLNHCITIQEGKALDSLSTLIHKQVEPFDFIFIDADKENNKSYLDYAIQLSRPGTLILIDNLIPKGEQIGSPCNHEAIAIYQFNQYLAHHPSLDTIVVPTIAGNQGRLDGIGIARLKN